MKNLWEIKRYLELAMYSARYFLPINFFRLMKEARGKWKISHDHHLPASKSSALKQLSFIAISRGTGARPVESCYRDLDATDHPLTPVELVWGRCFWLYSRKTARLSLNTHDTWCRDGTCMCMSSTKMETIFFLEFLLFQAIQKHCTWATSMEKLY